MLVSGNGPHPYSSSVHLAVADLAKAGGETFGSRE
jgi:hypothetical protein